MLFYSVDSRCRSFHNLLFYHIERTSLEYNIFNKAIFYKVQRLCFEQVPLLNFKMNVTYAGVKIYLRQPKYSFAIKRWNSNLILLLKLIFS